VTRIYGRYFRATMPGLIGIALTAAALTTAQAQAPIRIAGSLPISGKYAELGKGHERGYRVCLKQANDRGGVLGRRVEYKFEDDQSQAANAEKIYEKLLASKQADLVFSSYSSPITERVASVTEKYRMPMIAAGAASTSIFRKGRKYVFMILSPASSYLEGLVDIASKRGLKTMAILYEDTLFPKAIAKGTIEYAKQRGLNVVVAESYPSKTTDFSKILSKVKAANIEVVAAAT
jgi:branched-chain amino acid transport system substrate-binding protein